MKSCLMRKVAGFLAAPSLALVAFVTPAPASGGGPAPPVAAGRNLSLKASVLLARLHQHAYALQESADTLEGFNRATFLVDWRTDASTLVTMRAEVNRMDRILSRLRTMEKMLPSDQQAEINKTTPAVLELTNTDQAAANYLKNNQDSTMFPQYMAFASEIHDEAVRIERSTVTPAEKAIANAS
ncbi:MAG TPA: hypothetical protein VEO19_15940 [Terriglobia bacterium]|nr:hypothetical protein [Terriglobia bacterium]